MDTLPTFSGFPQAGFAFLADLAAHNNRAWFETHKQDFQALLLAPAQAFVMTLGTHLQALSKSIRSDPRTDGQGVLMRLYRDTRFSPDKTPYHTHLSGLFWAGSQKKTERPAFGFQIEATGMGLMTGIFRFPPPLLAAYREAVIDDHLGTALEDALETVRRTGQYAIAGEVYKRVPLDMTPTSSAPLCYRKWARKPPIFSLSFIHKLQTEMKSEMNALKQGLNAKPALPQSFPTRRAITTAGQIATHLGDGFPERLGRHLGGRLTSLRGHYGEYVSIQNLLSGSLRLPARQVAQLQQTNGQRRQEAQQAFQTVNRLNLALFEMAAGFETLMIVLYDPAMLIPIHSLPGLFQSQCRHRGQQHPFQRLFSGWGVFFPDTNRPQREWFFAAPCLKARSQDGQVSKGELHHRQASGASMTGRNLQRTIGHRRPPSHFVKQMGLGLLFWLKSSVLEPSHQKMRLGGLTRLKKREHIGSAIAHMHHQCVCWIAAQALNQPHPDVRFSRVALASFASRLPCWGWRAHKWLLDRAAQHLAALWDQCQDRLQIQSASLPSADLPHPTRFRMMREVYVRRVLHQQDGWPGLNLGARLVPMWVHQCLKSHIIFREQAVQGNGPFPGVHLVGQGPRRILGHLACHVDGPACSSQVLESARPKGFFGPAFWVQDGLRIHLSIVATY